MSIKLVFQDGKGHTLHEKDFTSEGGAAVIPGQGDLGLIPGGEEVKVKSRRFVYPDSDPGKSMCRSSLSAKGRESPMIIGKTAEPAHTYVAPYESAL